MYTIYDTLQNIMNLYVIYELKYIKIFIKLKEVLGTAKIKITIVHLEQVSNNQ